MELQLTAMYVVNSELLDNMLRFSNDKERPRRATFLKWEIITFNLIKSFLLNQIQKHLEIGNIVYILFEKKNRKFSAYSYVIVAPFGSQCNYRCFND